MSGYLTLVESPFKGRCAPENTVRTAGVWYYEPRTERQLDAGQNLAYAKALCRFVALRGDFPLASHVFCTQFLNDEVPEERTRGIAIGLAWGRHAQQTVVGVDRGISEGVALALLDARKMNRRVIWVSLEQYANTWLPEVVDRNVWHSARIAADEVVTHKGGI